MEGYVASQQKGGEKRKREREKGSESCVYSCSQTSGEGKPESPGKLCALSQMPIPSKLRPGLKMSTTQTNHITFAIL